MALDRIYFDTWNRSVRDVLRPVLDPEPLGALVFDPPYQRASVWTLEQRRSLIKSSLQGLPVGVIFINERKHDFNYYVVDGKQRLETFLMWFQNKLVVPHDWFEEELVADIAAGLSWITYDCLTAVGQRRFVNDSTISQYQTKLPTVEQEEELYLRINYGGTPHEPLGAH